MGSACRLTRWCQRLARSLVPAPVPLLIRQNRHKIKKPDKKANDDVAAQLIGQFGVGFYSAFMVAEKIEVLSRRHGSDQANLWVSDGQSGFSISDAVRDDIGTDITLHLRKKRPKNIWSRNGSNILLKNIPITLPSRSVGLGPKVKGAAEFLNGAVDKTG